MSDTFWATQNLMLREVFEILSRLTGVKMPSIKLPRLAITAVGLSESPGWQT